jgi:tRNA-Thr(GGU) m(6)t(6)A37 methyltransferase TsaA
MQTSRRKFMTTAMRRAAGGGLVAVCATAAHAEAPADGDPKPSFKLVPIGKVEKEGQVTRLRIFDEYGDGLLGLDEWSHVNVLYWFDKNDTPAQRRMLRVHPRGDQKNPLTGVFACRAPVRPNLIALSVCKIISVTGNVVTVEGLDAFDATPILDLKPFIPSDTKDLRTPTWTKQ